MDRPWGSGGKLLRSKNHGVISFFHHHGDGAPQWRAWGPPTGPMPVPVHPYSGMGYFRVYIKAVRRAEAIGGFVGDEIVIAMGDVPWTALGDSRLGGGSGRLSDAL